jgi:hypothetical protein
LPAAPSPPPGRSIPQIDALAYIFSNATSGHNSRELLRAHGIKFLVRIATGQWPVGGDVDASESEYDAVLELAPGQHRSQRRLAIGCLAEMVSHSLYLQAMQQEGLFAALPAMVNSCCPRFHPAASAQQVAELRRGRSQVQFIAERLVAIAAGAARVPALALQLLRDCGAAMLAALQIDNMDVQPDVHQRFAAVRRPRAGPVVACFGTGRDHSSRRCAANAGSQEERALVGKQVARLAAAGTSRAQQVGLKEDADGLDERLELAAAYPPSDAQMLTLWRSLLLPLCYGCAGIGCYWLHACLFCSRSGRRSGRRRASTPTSPASSPWRCRPGRLMRAWWR